MICRECETVAHCTSHGCIPKTTKKDEAMKLALEALNSFPPRHLTPFIISARTALREALAEQPAPVQLASTITITQRGSTRMIDNDFEDCVRDWPDGEYKLYTSPPAQQEPDAVGCKCSECGAWQRWTPSGMVCKNGHGGVPGVNHRLYTSPPAQRKPLTDEGLDLILQRSPIQAKYGDLVDLCRAIEAAHGIKENT